MKDLSSEKIKQKQKKFFLVLIAGCIGLVALLVSFTSEDPPQASAAEESQTPAFDVISQEIDPKTVRLSALENDNNELQTKISSLEQTLLDLREETTDTDAAQQNLLDATREIQNKLQALEDELHKPALEDKAAPKHLQAWQGLEKKEGKHVAFEIPAGTVVKAILVSGADCSVAVHKPTGPNMVLLRPLDNGHLPRNVRVPLKGSVIIGNAIGDISSERVYIRAERMSLVEKGGAFAETELSAYVSGEDGREGMRGVVVDRSGQIVARAAFAAFLQGIGQGAEAALQSKAFEKAAEKHSGLGFLPYGPMQGTTTAMSKLSDYYIKRAEQLQPAIQIAAGRVVDVVFTKTVRIGEKDLKKKFDRERSLKNG